MYTNRHLHTHHAKQYLSIFTNTRISSENIRMISLDAYVVWDIKCTSGHYDRALKDRLKLWHSSWGFQTRPSWICAYVLKIYWKFLGPVLPTYNRSCKSSTNRSHIRCVWKSILVRNNFKQLLLLEKYTMYVWFVWQSLYTVYFFKVT